MKKYGTELSHLQLMDATAPSIALGGQGHNVLPQMIEALHTFGQTPPLKNADLNLGHIEPTAMLGRVMHLQSLPDALRFLGRKRLMAAVCVLRLSITRRITPASTGESQIGRCN